MTAALMAAMMLPGAIPAVSSRSIRAAALFTASARPPGQVADTTAEGESASSRLTIIANRANPLITATVAIALGTLKRKSSQTVPRERRCIANGSCALR